jgi:hypothetical protein
MQILASSHLPSARDWPMEDGRDDADAEMAADSLPVASRTMGRTFRTMSTPGQTSLGNRESDPPFSRFLGGKRAVSRFGRDRDSESGSRGRRWHAGGFLV